MRYPAESPSRDPLAERLEHLAIEVPPFRSPSVAAGGSRKSITRRGHRRRNTTLALLAPAACLLLIAAADPNSIVQLSREALQAAGLLSSQVVPLAGEARHGATLVRVTGAYADNLHTVVFAEIDLGPDVGFSGSAVGACPPADLAAETCPAGDVGIYLMDQFGERYSITGGMGIGVGPYPISFEPLRGQAAILGARLTFHLSLADGVRSSHPDRFELVVPLSGSLAPKHATPLTLPAPIKDSTRNVSFAVVDLEYSDAYLEVHTRLTGDLQNVVTRDSGANTTGTTWPGVFLVQSSGGYHIPIVVSGPGRAIDNMQVQDETRIFGVKAGTYRVVVVKPSDHNGEPGAPGSVILAQWMVTVP